MAVRDAANGVAPFQRRTTSLQVISGAPTPRLFLLNVLNKNLVEFLEDFNYLCYDL